MINKAAGVATVPAHNVAEQDSLVNRVKYYYQKQGYENQVTHVATRLDKDTSGLVIFPKHRFAHAVLDNQLKRHLVKKEYVALVSGQVATSMAISMHRSSVIQNRLFSVKSVRMVKRPLPSIG